ncbi:hypothetical protein N6G95_09610 [Pediococcus inopinatus]|uniref:hypothetical protein n=1 Tax=Pediococcus inopinatus TaxID=114090 RepID=UPI002B26320E|nr:hypothetical protein [Pediococcus inopinatus]WPC19459.1 hypothetical protein N6G95_09610 [Pediococcus inopinatus]
METFLRLVVIAGVIMAITMVIRFFSNVNSIADSLKRIADIKTKEDWDKRNYLKKGDDDNE